MATQLPSTGEQMGKQLEINDAYARAVAKLKAERASRQMRAGLQADWSVDPRLQYGTYQALLQQQGAELDDAVDAAFERGLWGTGLGNQAERFLRYKMAMQNTQFKQQMADYESEYQQGLLDAEQARARAMMDAATPDYGDGGGADATSNQSTPVPINDPSIPGSYGYDWSGLADSGYTSKLPPGTINLFPPSSPSQYLNKKKNQPGKKGFRPF